MKNELLSRKLKKLAKEHGYISTSMLTKLERAILTNDKETLKNEIHPLPKK
jgi:hypothetical protein